MSVSIQEAVDELNFTADFAGIKAEIKVVGPTSLSFLNEVYEVDPAWAKGNAMRLPDRCTPAKLVAALRASHPDVKTVGPKV